MNASELIRKIRLKTGLSQEDFARAIHVSYGTVNRWENNKSKPNRMAKAWITDFCEKNDIDKELIDEIQKIRGGEQE
jgi:transcriptional regulator with XRE-family HTH domain